MFLAILQKYFQASYRKLEVHANEIILAITHPYIVCKTGTVLFIYLFVLK
jgi:hypothetical protein